MKLRLGSLSAVVAVLAAVFSFTPARAAAYSAGTNYFSFKDDQIVESSGIVASSKRDGVFFTHNDSGDVPRFFAVDDQGCTLARYALTGLPADVVASFTTTHDVEDIARGPYGPARTSTIWLADIGDNLHQRSEIAVYGVVEPNSNASTHRESNGCATPAAESVPATMYRLQYPDVAHDAETLLADPVSGQLFIVSKAPTGESQVYAAPATLDPNAVNVLSFVTEIVYPPSATYDRTPDQMVAAAGSTEQAIYTSGRLWAVGGDIAPDRSRVVVRTYTDAFEWAIAPGADLATTFAGIPTQRSLQYDPQGEAIAYTRDGRSLVTTSESAHSTVHLYAPA